jgi:hypothetical protein
MNEQVPSDPTPTTDGRQNNGTFAAGNQFGRGNPFARKVAAFRAALMEAVTEQDIKDIACKLRDDAKAGDKAATKLLFQYVIGKPQPAVDPDTLDAQEMRTFAANSLPSEAIVQMQEAVPLGWLAPPLADLPRLHQEAMRPTSRRPVRRPRRQGGAPR